ncbi:hypothetical protein [Streptomyces sp. NPDC002403]
MGIEAEVVERDPADAGFVPQPKRWIVERTNGILMLHRRLVRDYEHRTASAESRVYWAMSDRMSRMLTGTSVPRLARRTPDGFDTVAEEIRITRKTLPELPDPPPPVPPSREATGPSGLPADHGGTRRDRCLAVGTGDV